MKLSRNRQITGLALASALVLAGCGSDQAVDDGAGAASDVDCVEGGGTLDGAGASSQENAMAAWIAAYTGACEGATVNYDAVGSGAGRTQFIDDAVSFAGSDAALDEDETEQAAERCDSDVVNIPGYISPIAVAFNIEGVDSLNLTPEVIADIFNQEITQWNDDAIAELNDGVELPDTEIIPVNRSDESGTTENFTAYLEEAAGDKWPHEVSGDWPVESVEAAQGSSGIVSAIEGGEGTIGYVDASHAGELGTAAVGVGDDEFVEFSPEAAAAIVDASEPREENTEHDLAIDLNYTGGGGEAYPIVLVSYEVACLEYANQEDADLVKSFLGYITSEEGQEVAAEEGAAPLTDETRENVQNTIDQISAAS